jgi:hypothetical protein
MKRFDYPEDRLDFNRWLKAPGPCKSLYRSWRIDHGGMLVIELQSGEVYVAYAIDRIELFMSKCGWRWMVAQVLRMLRRKLWLAKADRRFWAAREEMK